MLIISNILKFFIISSLIIGKYTFFLLIFFKAIYRYRLDEKIKD